MKLIPRAKPLHEAGLTPHQRRLVGKFIEGLQSPLTEKRKNRMDKAQDSLDEATAELNKGLRDAVITATIGDGGMGTTVVEIQATYKSQEGRENIIWLIDEYEVKEETPDEVLNNSSSTENSRARSSIMGKLIMEGATVPYDDNSETFEIVDEIWLKESHQIRRRR